MIGHQQQPLAPVTIDHFEGLKILIIHDAAHATRCGNMHPMHTGWEQCRAFDIVAAHPADFPARSDSSD
jgi:hypothetical protein